MACLYVLLILPGTPSPAVPPTDCESSVTFAELLDGLLLSTSPLQTSILLLVDDYRRRAQPAVGDTIPRLMGLGCIRKQAEREPARIMHPWFLPQVPALISLNRL